MPAPLEFRVGVLPWSCITCGWVPETVVEVLVVIFDVLLPICKKKYFYVKATA